MKQIAFYLFVILLSLTLVMIIVYNAPKRVSKIIFVETTYSYLVKDQVEMDVSFYMNEKNHPLASQDAYEYLYLANLEDTKRLEVTLKNLSSSHYEEYLGEDYLKLNMTLLMPYLDGNFEIKDLYISIFLENQDEYSFQLGSLFISETNESINHLDWIGLNGVKHENIFLSRLGEIHIDYHQLLIPIDHISIGTDDLVTFTMMQNQLILSIPFQESLLFDVPIIITFVDDSVQTLDNFPYIIDYQVIKESGPLLHVYALN